MNMPNKHNNEQDFDYQSEGDQTVSGREKIQRQRRFQYARTNRPAAAHNGIHRRRNKRFSW